MAAILDPKPKVVPRSPTYLDEQRTARVNLHATELDAVLAQCGASPEILAARRSISGHVTAVLLAMLKV